MIIFESIFKDLVVVGVYWIFLNFEDMFFVELIFIIGGYSEVVFEFDNCIFVDEIDYVDGGKYWCLFFFFILF